MQIKTIAYHQAEIAAHAERQVKRLDCDVSDVALSTWASDQTMRAHRVAIAALELGAANGINGPAGVFPRLMHGARVVDAKQVNGQYGRVWLLSDAEASTFGRRFVPIGEKSRVQRKLGLTETEVIAPAKPFLGATDPGWIGGTVNYFTIEA